MQFKVVISHVRRKTVFAYGVYSVHRVRRAQVSIPL